jgi:hypothetical protein
MLNTLRYNVYSETSQRTIFGFGLCVHVQDVEAGNGERDSVKIRCSSTKTSRGGNTKSVTATPRLRQGYSTFKLLSINPLRQETYGNKLNREPIEPHTHPCVLNGIGLTESMFRDTDGIIIRARIRRYMGASLSSCQQYLKPGTLSDGRFY